MKPEEMHPIMFIHTDPSFPVYYSALGDTNRKTHDQIAKDAIENHYTVKPSGNRLLVFRIKSGMFFSHSNRRMGFSSFI